jgi:hypothetical protein
MIDVIKQMVEALEWCHGGEPVGTAEAIQAGKKLIAELESQYPHGMYGAEDLDKAWKSGYDNCKDQFAYLDEQEPVAWACRVVGGRKWLSIHASKGASDKWLEYRIKEQAQGEQYEQVKLHTHPQQRKPLTDEQIKKASLEAGMQEHYMDFHSGFIRFAKAIEAAHGITGEKNG